MEILTCRTEALAARLQGATDLGRTKATLMKQAAKLDADLRDAEAQMGAGDARKASERLKRRDASSSRSGSGSAR